MLETLVQRRISRQAYSSLLNVLGREQTSEQYRYHSQYTRELSGHLLPKRDRTEGVHT